ncbi:hypothetical protein KSP40_PGU009648 [Platanthera guangdongensis]|uniref:Uncharacterized protein n=1 Tax=Platanthera guangdongensis TaxID=2320717 RepID=A0ABR2N2H1_9ASPA
MAFSHKSIISGLLLLLVPCFVMAGETRCRNAYTPQLYCFENRDLCREQCEKRRRGHVTLVAIWCTDEYNCACRYCTNNRNYNLKYRDTYFYSGPIPYKRRPRSVPQMGM